MSLEKNIISYFAAFDGTNKDFSQIESLFDAVFDDRFVQVDGNTLNKEQLKRIHANGLALGSKARVVSCKRTATDSIEYKVFLTNKVIEEVVIHLYCKVKKGKIVRAKAIGDSAQSLLRARRLMTFYDVEQKFRALVSSFDGTVKSFDEIEKPFEDLLHDEFVNSMGIDKDGMRDKARYLLSIATKAELLQLKVLDDFHFEARIHIKNSIADITTHPKGTIKDGHVVKLQTYEDAGSTHEKLRGVFELSDLLQGIRTYEKTQNRDYESTLKDLEKSVESIFHDELEADLGGGVMNKDEVKKLKIQEYLANSRIHFEKMKVLDTSHIDVFISKENGWRRHQVLTVKDGKIIKIEPAQDEPDESPLAPLDTRAVVASQ